MASKMVSTIALAAGLAAAANTDPVVPLSAQIGALDFGVTCNVPVFGNYTFEGYFTATAPIQGASGQQIYYTDLVAAITIPSSLTGLGKFVSVSHAKASVKVQLDLENATPATYDVFPEPLVLDNITFTPGEPVTVRVPTTGTLPPLGPVTLGQAGKTHLIHLGEVDIDLTLLNNDGSTFLFPLPIKCPPSEIRYDIGIVNILDPSLKTPAAPTTNGTYKFAKISNNEETGSFRFPYSCDFSNGKMDDVDLTISGTVPTYLHPGDKWSVKDAFAYLRLSPATVADLTSGFTGVTMATTIVKQYNITVENGSPSSINALTTPIRTTSKVQQGQELDIALPADNTFSFGPFTAGASGQELFLTSAGTSGSFAFMDQSGRNVGGVDFQCKPKYTSRLIGIPVTNATPPPISK
ncbi:uncharacterized protein RCC_11276 [Ramularia collo-cygni]|uniref:DUF6801 domain-containing protein n=1 Tax=Ramularia collo-cygni TaxID=112498 RepID=A0A2D3VBS4_9PEZI|nr:uncharacterized protein RCC_11276 [Ramularia collo-cygni]CZT25543.1 uncharacterized protein RCC_11276 [Ramularia collo-cygni]